MNFGVASVPLGILEDEVRNVLAPSVACDPCEDADDVLSAVNEGDAQLWLITDDQLRGVVVTKIVGGAKGRQCFVWHWAGPGIREWKDFLEVIMAWAKSEGCSSIEAIGRHGLERMLGWKRQAVVLRKAL